MRVSKQPLVNFPAWFYTYVIRGTPMLVQLFLIYYGLAQFDAVRESARALAVERPSAPAWRSPSTPAPTPPRSSPAA